MSGSNFMTKKVAIEVAMLILSQAAAFYTLKWFMDSMGPNAERKSAKSKSGDVLKRLGHKDLKLNEYEQTIASEVIHPEDIGVGFENIGGLDPIISSLRESVIYPLVFPELFTSSSLLSAPKGVLLYGPPGCGKTMLARALAKESGATFINIAVSTLANKWERKSGDHEVTATMKAEFMTLWDGLLSASDRILVLGATNRPNDIDSAILRRMPKRYPVSLPDEKQRLKILNLMLSDTPLSPELSLETLAIRTAGMSGSDLKELCRDAAMIPVREFLKESGGSREVLEKRSQEEGFKYRPLEMRDFSVGAPDIAPIVPLVLD
ncbi:AAA-domain-containing [Pyrrhoderma noxium]|uniref:AAA-domain-containing n=1 Tax=Pyrrhoderma noxium TaxID=2282107 RepID=A0A286UBI7_9AGAM|nr:AAA-domain-containing [Pyrrhoderma noxium]